MASLLRHLTITATRVGIFLALLFGAFALLALGFQLGGYYDPNLAKLFYVLAVVTFAGSFVAFLWPSRIHQRGQGTLQTWRNKIDEWASDQANPLPHAPADDLRRRRARSLTLEVLRQQDSEGKREVLLALHNWPLIQRFPYPVISLDHADLNGANLQGVDLRGASLKCVNLKDANLKGARLGQGPEDTSTMDRMARVVKKIAGDYTNSLESCDLRNAKLIGATLQGAVLVECALNGANFKGANFREADLRAADLRGALNLTQKQIDKAYGSYQLDLVRDTQLPDNVKPPESWRKPIYEQKRETILARLERAQAGP